MNPSRLPSVAPATMVIAETGFTYGTGANSTRPAAATAASVAAGSTCRRAGFDRS